MPRRRQVRLGFSILIAATVFNLIGNFAFELTFPWAMLPIAAYALGWAVLVPVVVSVSL